MKWFKYLKWHRRKQRLDSSARAVYTRRERILEMGVHGVTATEVEREFGYVDSGAYSILNTLIKSGLLEKRESVYYSTDEGLRVVGTVRVKVKRP